MGVLCSARINAIQGCDLQVKRHPGCLAMVGWITAGSNMLTKVSHPAGASGEIAYSAAERSATSWHCQLATTRRVDS